MRRGDWKWGVVVAMMGLMGMGQPAATTRAGGPVETPKGFEGAETFVYRKGESGAEDVRLHVVRPVGWVKGDRRASFVWFFGGGWSRGTPLQSIGWARQAAKWGMVGVAADYRVTARWKSTPMDSVADGRLAVRWVQEHAEELGIDPAKVVVGGSSAGGHLALWAAMEKVPAGSKAEESPLVRPAAVVLTSAASETDQPNFEKRFLGLGEKMTVSKQIEGKMPPVLEFHGEVDTTVPLESAKKLNEKLKAVGGEAELVVVPGGGHDWPSKVAGWDAKFREAIYGFLKGKGLVD